jgi:cytochrome bd-type quinol oxidase subunit 2
MSKDGHVDTERKAMTRSIALCTAIAIAAAAVVVYLRLSPTWVTSFKAQPVLMTLTVILLAVFYAGTLVSLANIREMGRAVSGWFDVLSLMVLTGILAYLIFGSLLYVSVVVLLCSAFVLYVHLAQRA